MQSEIKVIDDNEDDEWDLPLVKTVFHDSLRKQVLCGFTACIRTCIIHLHTHGVRRILLYSMAFMQDFKEPVVDLSSDDQKLSPSIWEEAKNPSSNLLQMSTDSLEVCLVLLYGIVYCDICIY